MNPTPMMQQYFEAKRACPGAILLFRMGDFYELFHDDAKTAARILGLALTSREKGENAIPMAGFPHPALESYLAKLIAAGQRVAIAEQVEDPKQAKGLVRRELTRIVTAGTLTDDALLDPRQSNFLAAVVQSNPVGIAWVELSTGQFFGADIAPENLLDELARIAPAEVLVCEGEPTLPFGPQRGCLVTSRPAWAFRVNDAHQALLNQFGVATLEGFGWETPGPAIGAAGAILDYLRETQRAALTHLDRLLPHRRDQAVHIDEATRRSLELVRTFREGRREGALLGVLDRTTTAMGSRLLAEWLANPLSDRAQLDARLDAVSELHGDAGLSEAVRTLLAETYDLQRLVARITTGRASPRDLSFVGRTLRMLPKLKALLTGRKSSRLGRLETDLDLLPQIRGQLEAALVDDCPLSPHEGGILRPGFNADLDRLRDLAAGGKQWIAQYQAAEVERSGISSLKVGYNKVFGYYIEITHSQQAKVPAEYIRKQTVKNAERYITPELKQYEEQVLSAVDQQQALEYQLFCELRDLVAAAARRLQETARTLAELDVLVSLATLARERGYCRPTLVAEPTLLIEDGRHPVLDAVMADGTFVPNDTQLGQEHGTVVLITGPNMAGKSTYIRQVALITLLAHLGSFVPARRAVIGMVDRIFARVGASDELARGHSTFMVEMTETARILHSATPRSLIILDEIGRGTSTYDGVSLAWAIAEYLHNEIGARTLFATHYHELTQLAQELPGVRNLTVAVQEWNDQVVFLHKIVPGAADKSYGLHVARLAGVPSVVIDRAGRILAHLEADHVPAEVRMAPVRRNKANLSNHRQRMLFSGE